MRRLAFVAALVFTSSACDQDATSTDGTRTIQIEMRDFAFAPETLTLRAGEKVVLKFTNVGKLEHEFTVGTDPAIGKGYLKEWLAGALTDGGGEHGMGHAGEGVRVAPNTTMTLTINVPNQGGVFEFGCFVSGHYEFGMRGRLVVDAESPPSSTPTGQRPGGQKPPAGATPTHGPMGDDDSEGH